jgi:menaquinone-dependent protoporphyrinogen IX oxidase
MSILVACASKHGATEGIAERVVAIMPAARAAFPEGDFRDWDDIGNWAESIAHELSED